MQPALAWPTAGRRSAPCVRVVTQATTKSKSDGQKYHRIGRRSAGSARPVAESRRGHCNPVAGGRGGGCQTSRPGAAASPIQEQRVDETQLLALWQFAANNTQLPHIGLLIGQTFNPATHGVLASWLRQCSRVSEVLEVFQRHIALMNPSESWQYSETADALVLEITFAPAKPTRRPPSNAA
nr:AraC family transcriptional regulator [Pseudomonas sp. BIGb0427]